MMTVTDTALPEVVSRVEWLAARKALLAKEKALTRHRQEDWEEPSGRSDGPFMHWVRRHDRYDVETAAPDAASPGTDSCCGSRAHRAYSSPEGEMP
jgi:predicted dithiol-disulfide oxidoreductase (DUF899 family)